MVIISLKGDVMCTDHRDLCSTCNHAPTCDNCGTADKPVFYCEEIDIYVPVTAKETPASVPNPTKTINSDKYKGLCFNCESREVCVFPIPQGGIWHCEEYR